MRFTLPVAALALTGLFFGCSDKPTTPDTPTQLATPTSRSLQQLAQEEPELFRAVNDFSFTLFAKTVEGATARDNVFLSPLSVAYAVAMCYNGAAGETRTAIAQTLQLESYTDDQINRFFRDLMTDLPLVDSTALLEIANSVWHTDSLIFRTQFVDLVTDYFGAEVSGLDFLNDASADTINAWVDSTTHGCIKEIVRADQLREMVVLILNAIYFKGAWTISFDTALTRELPFAFGDGSYENCLMMLSDTSYEYLENDLLQGVRLPYGDGSYAMMVLVPKVNHTVSELVLSLSVEQWEQWNSELNVEESLTVILPKLKLEKEYLLSEMLEAMGMSLAFADAADFSRMTEGGGVRISDVKQKTFLQVDEMGTEAAAVTAIGLYPTDAAPPLAIVANRPFVLAICEKTTGAILFLGRIADPVW